MSRTYVIADLHGRADLLKQALEIIKGHASGRGGKFICLGDFVDRGPASREIIDILMAGPSLPGWDWIVLQGNHEAMMLECLGDFSKLRWWFGNGGVETLHSYGYRDGDEILPLRIPPDNLHWLAARPITHQDTHRIYVHAGVPFDQDVEAAPPKTLQWMLYPGEVEHPGAEFHPDLGHVSGKHIVHGHHQSPSHPLLKAHRTNLDAFAWRSGRLPIGVFDDDVPGGPVEVLWAKEPRP